MKITQIYSCVFAELKVNEEARKDDNALIVGVLRRLHTETILTDETWTVKTDCVTFAGIYDGETIDHTHIPEVLGNAVLDDCG